jgi:hypothetical protein
MHAAPSGAHQEVSVRLVVSSLVLLGLSVPAMAQEQGSVALDAMTTPGRHFGIGYYITDGLSLRPSLGVSYSGSYGTALNLGADVRWELMTERRVSPYLTASFNYLHNPSVAAYTPYYPQSGSDGAVVPIQDPNVTRYGAGAGVRAHLKYRISLVGEGRVMNSELRTVNGYYTQPIYQNGAHFEAAVGLSYAFN